MQPYGFSRFATRLEQDIAVAYLLVSLLSFGDPRYSSQGTSSPHVFEAKCGLLGLPPPPVS